MHRIVRRFVRIFGEFDDNKVAKTYGGRSDKRWWRWVWGVSGGKQQIIWQQAGECARWMFQVGSRAGKALSILLCISVWLCLLFLYFFVFICILSAFYLLFICILSIFLSLFYLGFCCFVLLFCLWVWIIGLDYWLAKRPCAWQCLLFGSTSFKLSVLRLSCLKQ